MLFTPNRIEIKKDEQVKFVLRNNGELDHEFIRKSQRKAACPNEDGSNRLEIHQGRRIRMFVPRDIGRQE